MANALLLGLLTAVLLGIPVGFYVAPQLSPAPPSMVDEEAGFMDHIDHIVFVVLENHAYDNYFGTYCLTPSDLCPQTADGLPAGTCVPYDPATDLGGCIRPWNFGPSDWTLEEPLYHNYSSSHQAWDNGAMDGFYAAENSGLIPFGHYNGTTAPIDWDLAEEFSLSDDFFSSILSYSLPNHWHIVAGQAPEAIIPDGPVQCTTCSGERQIQTAHTYLNESNRTTSVEDLLLNSSVSWKYYDFTLGSYASSIQIQLNDTTHLISSYGHAFNYWNPQAAKAESYDQAFVNHFVKNTQFYSDASAGDLPDLSWVIPPGQFSDHPSTNSTLAQSWLASIVDAVEASPDWPTTALYITWDDYGGFYDHVDPPTFEGQQLGFRVPLLLVSPYTVAGSVSDSFGFFESVLHLMEWRFHLGCISDLDCNAPLPVFGFDWTGPPRAPVYFPTNFSGAQYPYVSSPWFNDVPAGPYVPPTEFTYFPNGEAPDVD